jgi:hypothetical protein
MTGMSPFDKTVPGIALAAALALAACAEHKDRSDSGASTSAIPAQPTPPAAATTDREGGPREHAGY